MRVSVGLLGGRTAKARVVDRRTAEAHCFAWLRYDLPCQTFRLCSPHMPDGGMLIPLEHRPKGLTHDDCVVIE